MGFFGEIQFGGEIMTTEGFTLAELKAQIMIVAEARSGTAKLKRQRDLLLENWNKNNQELLDDLTQAGASVAVEESKLRELTLRVYRETGSKSPAEGVGVREITTYSYDGAEAFKWAVEHKMALKLDDTAFKAIAKAQIKTDPIPFVACLVEPQATIATDLSKVLEENE